MRFKNLSFLLLIILFQIACKKDSVTQPSKVIFNFNLLNGEDYYIKAKSGSIFISNIEFAGVRDGGSSFYFSTNMDSSILINYASQTFMKIAEFDIPTGIYEKVVTKLSILYDNNSSRNNQSRFSLNANFKNSKGIQIAIKYESKIENVLEIEGVDKTGGKIKLDLNKTSNAVYQLKVIELFQGILQNEMEQAIVDQSDDVPTIVINEKSNLALYNKIASNLRHSFELLFNVTI